ncbi:MAG: RNA methyltransferase [Pseudomonadota bacterium]
MRGYFAIGVQGLSKPMNAGNLVRTAHGFGASFVFVIDPHPRLRAMHADTARSSTQVPFYLHDTLDDLALPRHCQLVGVELTEDAVDLPSFHHPTQAAYLLGPERTGLDAATLARCDHVIRIPTAFSLNVATAGAVVMYDRMRMLGNFPARPTRPGGPTETVEHRHGGPFFRGSGGRPPGWGRGT